MREPLLLVLLVLVANDTWYPASRFASKNSWLLADWHGLTPLLATLAAVGTAIIALEDVRPTLEVRAPHGDRLQHAGNTRGPLRGVRHHRRGCGVLRTGSRDRLLELMARKQRAALSRDSLLAAIPSWSDGTVSYLFTDRRSPLPRRLEGRPDAATEPEAARLWDALHARFPGELPANSDLPRM